MKRLLIMLALVLGMILPLTFVTTPSQAAAPAAAPTLAAAGTSPKCTLFAEGRKKEADHITHKANIYSSLCRRPKAGHDIWWVKSKMWIASYKTDGNWKYRCGILWYFDGAKYTLHVWNNHTGYNFTRHMTLPCEDDHGSGDSRGLTDTPRCYVPWVPSEGRAPGAGHREWCHYRFTVHEKFDQGMPDVYRTIGQGYLML